MVTRCLALATVLGALTVSVQAQTVYTNDFSANANGFSTSGRVSLPTTSNSASPLSSMLGKFANNEFTSLDITGLTPGETYDVAFDLFIGGSWDGNNSSFGPDRWILSENNSGQLLVNTTFSRLTTPGFDQSYSDASPTGPGVYAPTTGADVISTDPDWYSGYNLYYFGRGAGNPYPTFTANSQGVASLTFRGQNLQNVDDEYWAVDNVAVRRRVPEPGAGLLVFLALPAAAFLRRRK